MRVLKISFLISLSVITMNVFANHKRSTGPGINISPCFDVTIGQRSSDSTGTINISNSGIQQSIIAGDSLLLGNTISSEAASLLVGKRAAYLLFSVTDTAGNKSAIAVELYESSSGSFTFKHGIGKTLHIAKGANGCLNCLYKLEFGMIMSSGCSGGVACKHQIHYNM